MVQLPIPIGPDISLPQPINPAANVVYPGGLMGMWVVNPDGSLSPTASNTNPTLTLKTLQILAPDSAPSSLYTLTQTAEGTLTLSNPGQQVFSFNQGAYQNTLGGNIIFVGSQVNPQGNNTTSLGTAALRYANIFGVNGDFSGNLNVAGTLTLGGTSPLAAGGGVNSGTFTVNNAPSGTAVTFLTPVVGQSFAYLVVASIPAVARNWVCYIFVSNGTNYNGGLIGGVTSQLTIVLDATFLQLQVLQTTGSPASVVVRVLRIS